MDVHHLRRRSRRRHLAPLLALLLLSPGSSGCSRHPPREAPATTTRGAPTPTLADARAFYAAQPRFLQPFPFTEVPAGLDDLRAESCGGCHKEIYEEWRISTHARAWLDDPQFQAELEKSGRDGRDTRWMCVNCHTPLENQLPRLVAGLEEGRLDAPRYVDNPHFDAKLQLEAITCATCHVRDGVVLGPTGADRAPHPVRKDPALLEPTVCTQCHQANAHFPELVLACAFDTGRELEAGPYAAEGKTCQSCHMPEAPRAATGTPPRASRRHWFGGSLIAKQPGFAAELEPLREVFPDGLAVRWSPQKEAVAGTQVRIVLELENAYAGHLLPTGDPERFLRIRLEAIDAEGRSLASREERIGAVYQWWPEVKLISDNRLKPKEKRELELSFTAPPRGPVTLRTEASKWRINEENLKFHRLEARYVPGRTFFEETRRLEITTPR